MYRHDNLQVYEYRGYNIWCPNDLWITEPLWQDINAIDNFKCSGKMEYHKTIAQAKKWVRENGAKYKETDFQ